MKSLTPETLAQKLAKLSKQDLLQVDQFIEFLTFRSAQSKRKKIKKDQHPGFGMWAKQLEGVDSAEYSLELRRKAARRADVRASD